MKTKISAIVAMLQAGLWLMGTTPVVMADPHVGQSHDVVFIGSPVVVNGGTLPTAGPVGELGDFIFSNLSPAAVNAASLAPFDTVVLNVASPQMNCTTNTLTPQAKADLVAFVATGKKLIIYDSECPPVDYTWLPFPFTTSNPGAMGAFGTLTIVEENTLSTSPPGDPHYIDVVYLGTQTDAVGDMNVMTTYDPNWYLDMTGTNVLNVTGPVHTYANYPAGTDKGLIIYNGLDVDLIGITPQLRKIWVQELQQPFNPSNLPSSFTVVGITLTPATAINEAGTNHTVTAALFDLQGNPQTSVSVTFNVISGPNTGVSGTGVTDTDGEVAFTYTSSAAGTDQIQANFTNLAGTVVYSNVVTKEWVITNAPPDTSNACASMNCVWPPNHKFVPITIGCVTDPDGDPITINVTAITSDEPTATITGAGGAVTHVPDASGLDTEIASVRAERSGTGDGRVYEITFTATDGKATSVGKVRVNVPLNQSGKNCNAIDNGQLYDATLSN